MAKKDRHLLQVKFRIFDGTDICDDAYSSSITVSALKHKLLSQWPQDKSVVPKSENVIKIIHAGKILENRKTLCSCVSSDLHGGLITMHVVVQPALAIQKIGKNQSDKQKHGSCGCSIL